MAEEADGRRSIEIDKSVEADMDVLPEERDVESGEIELARIEKVYK